MPASEVPELTDLEIGQFNWLIKMIESAPGEQNYKLCIIRAELDGEPVSVMAIDHGHGESPIPSLTPVAVLMNDGLFGRLVNPFTAEPLSLDAVLEDDE